MHENLQRLTRELRNEVCPQRVRDEVARRISSQERPAGSFRYALPATATLLILCGLVVWRWPESRHTQPRLAQLSTVERARVIAQAEGVLGYVGNVLLRAGARSETVLNKEAVPELRNRFESGADKIIQLLNQ